MKKKNIAWLLSGAMILTTAAAPVETVSVYAAEEFQADETEAVSYTHLTLPTNSLV